MEQRRAPEAPKWSPSSATGLIGDGLAWIVVHERESSFRAMIHVAYGSHRAVALCNVTPRWMPHTSASPKSFEEAR